MRLNEQEYRRLLVYWLLTVVNLQGVIYGLYIKFRSRDHIIPTDCVTFLLLWDYREIVECLSKATVTCSHWTMMK